MVPERPTIQARPIGTLNALEFWWSGSKDQDITYYTLQCPSANIMTIVEPSSFYALVPNLINKKPYTFQLSATNNNGTGPKATFDIAQPGNKPAGPTDLKVSALNTSTALITWNYITESNESDIKWFKLTTYPKSGEVTSKAVYGNQTSTIVNNITYYTNYVFQVQAINDAGYDDGQALTSTIILGHPIAPTAIHNISTTLITNDTISLSWSGGTNALSYMYLLNNISTIVPADNTNNASFTNLISNTDYNIELIAINDIGQSSSLFLPTNIPALEMWLDSKDPNTIQPPSGTPILTWMDKSGNSNNAEAHNNPIYTTNGILLNGTDTYFTITSQTNRKSKSKSIFIVFNLNSNTQASLVDSEGSNFQSMTAGQGPSLIDELYGSYPVTTGISYLAECIYSPTGINIYVSGNLSASKSTSNSQHFTTDKTSIGASASANYLNGYISEVVIYNSALSESNRQELEGYLAWKWNIQSQLPVNHPYGGKRGGLIVRTCQFAPIHLSGLQIWLDASDTHGIISIWSDKSGNSNNAVAHNSPYIIDLNASNASNASNAVNAVKAVKLNGSTQYLTAPYNGNHQTETVFVVMTFTNTSGEQDIICGNNSKTRQFVVYQNKLNLYSFAEGGLIASANPVPSDQAIFGYTLNSEQVNLYINASLASSAPGFVTSTESYINIGLNGFNNNGCINGSISEVLIYNSVLSISDRQIVEGYLAWKWSIQGSLPINHPYYKSAP